MELRVLERLAGGTVVGSDHGTSGSVSTSDRGGREMGLSECLLMSFMLLPWRATTGFYAFPLFFVSLSAWSLAIHCHCQQSGSYMVNMLYSVSSTLAGSITNTIATPTPNLLPSRPPMLTNSRNKMGNKGGCATPPCECARIFLPVTVNYPIPSLMLDPPGPSYSFGQS